MMTPVSSRNGRVCVRAETETLGIPRFELDLSLTHVWTVHKGTSRLSYCELGGTELN